MPKDFSVYCKAASVLLHYPSKALFHQLHPPGSVPVQVSAPEQKEALDGFAAYLLQHRLQELQMRHTALFDLSPATTLNLTCHLPGDPAQQARHMSDLQGVYAAAGYEKISSELPDHLPLLLEFIAQRPDLLVHPVIGRVLAGLAPLVDRLQKYEPAYARLLQPLLGEVRRLGRGEAARGDGFSPDSDKPMPAPREEVCHEHP